jgi:hypothetical protein
MRRLLSIALCLIAADSLAQSTAEPPEATLEQGIQQVADGNFSAALITLDGVARALAVDPQSHADELSKAYLYRGVAFVGMAQEENAKGSFAAALQYDRTLRLSEAQFSPRVVRVFEAARQGKTKSVLLPPSGTAKKAGIGAATIGLIVAGVAVAGGAAVAAGGGSSQSATTTTTTTTMPPPMFMPTATDHFSVAEITLKSTTPGPGATIPHGAQVDMAFAVTYKLRNYTLLRFEATVFTPDGNPCAVGSAQIDTLRGVGVETPLNTAISASSGSCARPFTTTRMRLQVHLYPCGIFPACEPIADNAFQEWSGGFTFQ